MAKKKSKARVEQLSLFPAYLVGERVKCPAGEGVIYFVSTYVWVEVDRVARPWDQSEVSKL